MTHERTWAEAEETVISGIISHFFFTSFHCQIFCITVNRWKTFLHISHNPYYSQFHCLSFSFFCFVFPLINHYYLLYLLPLKFFLAIYYRQFFLFDRLVICPSFMDLTRLSFPFISIVLDQLINCFSYQFDDEFFSLAKQFIWIFFSEYKHYTV